MGATTALSAKAAAWLQAAWGDEDAAWRKRSVGEHRYAYLWSDGFYLEVGTDGAQYLPHQAER